VTSKQRLDPVEKLRKGDREIEIERYKKGEFKLNYSNSIFDIS
jgi:hypothetical protein